MTLWKVALTAFATLIAMVNPLAVIPQFLLLTEGPLMKRRREVALIAGLGTMAMLNLFLFAGDFIFRFFGITIAAFQIMGGIVFSSGALRTLSADDRKVRRVEPPNEDVPSGPVEHHADPLSVAIVPLSIPILAGPGAITSTMVLVNLYPSIEQRLALVGAIAVVGLVVWLTFLAAGPISHVMGERGRAVFNKIMALLLAAIGIQFILNGLRTVLTEILRAT